MKLNKVRKKVKRVKRAVGRLRTPAPKIIPDKREKLREEAEKKEFKS